MLSQKSKVLLFSLCTLLLWGCSQAPRTQGLVVWHWLTDRQDALNDLAVQYQEKTGIPVEFKLFFPADIYSQKVIAAARAGNLPDIFGILGEKKILGSFIKAGHILDLTSYMEKDNHKWQNSFYPQTLAVTQFKKDNFYKVPPGTYAVPIDTTVMQFIYNRSVFQQVGLDPNRGPRTFDEFIAVAKQVKENLGIDGFVCGWGEGWLLNALATEWAINLMGEEKFLNTIAGTVSYTDPQWIKVFSLFMKLKESGVLASNIEKMTNKEAEDAFAKGKAVFSFNGSWAVNVYRQLNPRLDYAFFSLPEVSDKYPEKIWGGAGTSFMVHARSAQKEEAVRFLEWITQNLQQEFLVLKTNNLPAVKMDPEKFPSILKTLGNDLKMSVEDFPGSSPRPELEKLTHPNVWPKNEDARVIEVMNRGLQQIIMGLKTPQGVAQEIQAVKERVSQL
ncbi:MAG: extracellular solute-binding protein [Candidatus Omnitrophica bacterium]|nr:extracellular solute-binding protein [Candidatus Omnitrophota bacterium]